VDVNESEGDRGISLLLAVGMHCDVTTDCRGGKNAVNKHEHAQSVNNALVITVYLNLVQPFAIDYVLLKLRILFSRSKQNVDWIFQAVFFVTAKNARHKSFFSFESLLATSYIHYAKNIFHYN
jgi:hypothetical protein